MRYVIYFFAAVHYDDLMMIMMILKLHISSVVLDTELLVPPCIINTPLPQGIATADHTTLLLNCYTKLRDASKIDAFIFSTTLPRNTTAAAATAAAIAPRTSTTKAAASSPPMAQPSGAPLKFDPRAAIAVLRDTNYSEHALYVALAADDADAYLDILLNDCDRYHDALEFIRGLGRRHGSVVLLQHGGSLLEKDSVATTALLMELCLPAASAPVPGADVPKEREEEMADRTFVASLADYTHLYHQRSDDLRYACVTILAMSQATAVSQRELYHTLLDLYLTSGDESHSSNGGNKWQGASSSSTTTTAVTTTTSFSSDRDQALDLLRRGWPPSQDQPIYDIDRALTACRLHSFHQGLVFLYNNMRMYREATAVLASTGDWAGVLQACDRHGSAVDGGDPEIWHDALEKLSSLSAGPGAESALRQLLVRIEATGAMPLLSVLPVLARNPHLKLDVVKGYVERALQAENAAIEVDAKEAERLKDEVSALEESVRRLTTEPVVFQASKDSQTGAPLELPSVHFLCGHSFNLRTLGDGGSQECPLCAGEHRRVRELQRSHKASAADMDSFFRQLRAAPDGFSLVAKYFGKGVLNSTSVSR